MTVFISENDMSNEKSDKLKQINPVFIVIMDIVLIGFSLCVFALFHHVLNWGYVDSEQLHSSLTEKTFPPFQLILGGIFYAPHGRIKPTLLEILRRNFMGGNF